MVNVLYLIERYEINSQVNCETSNKNLLKIFETMNKYIVPLKKIKETYKFTSENYNLIKKTFALKNKDVDDFLLKINWPSSYSIIQKQILVSAKSIDYYIVNYFEESTDLTHYAVIYSFDSSYFTDSFYLTIENVIREKNVELNEDNRNFVLMFILLMKYHFEQITNFNSTNNNANLISGHDYDNNHKLYKQIAKKIKMPNT